MGSDIIICIYIYILYYMGYAMRQSCLCPAMANDMAAAGSARGLHESLARALVLVW